MFIYRTPPEATSVSEQHFFQAANMNLQNIKQHKAHRNLVTFP